MESIDVLDACYIPDDEKNNFLFDSCVYDKRLLENSTDINKLKRAKKIGYLYFKTAVQEREIYGIPDRNFSYKKPWTSNPNAHKIMKILDALDVKRISCYGHPGYLCFTALDGTYRVMESESSMETRVKMFYDIYNHNNRHLRDAIIAEAAIYNHCMLISVDNRLIRKVNNYFENAAMSYDEFIKLL